MCEQSRVFSDGDIVWVKLSNCWWPGEVHEDERLPADMVSAFKKKRPYAIVKFFQEDSYEYVKNMNNIYSYHCERRLDFIRKGLDLFQANNKYMEMFPADVATAERRTKGNPDIINDPALLNPGKQTPGSGRRGQVNNTTTTPVVNNNNKRTINQLSNKGTTKILINSTPVASPVIRPNKEHEVRILSSSTNRSPALGGGSGISGSGGSNATPQQMYKCHLCNFSSGRMNLLILHSKSHSAMSSSSSACGDARSSMIQHRQSTATMSTPTKRFSTASSCSTSSPALSPVSSPSSSSVTVAVAAAVVSTPAANKSRPPKKRTKRVPSSTEERFSPVPSVAVPAANPPTVASAPSASSKPTKTTTNTTSTRRSRHRRRSSTPPPQTEIEEATEEVTEESPIIPPPQKIRNVKLQESLLKDWSDDEEEEEQNNSTPVKKEEVTTASVTATPEVSPGKPLDDAKCTPPTADSATGRSSPIRCRNIPKKDRREIILDEFEPKVSPNRTQLSSGSDVVTPVTESVIGVPEVLAEVKEDVELSAIKEEKEVKEEEIIAVEEEEAEPTPIVQKKKKAAIERLSQKVVQDEVVSVAVVPVQEDVVDLKEDLPKVEEDVELVTVSESAEEKEKNNQNKLDSVAVTPPCPVSTTSPVAVVAPAISCFDFDEDSPPATVVPDIADDPIEEEQMDKDKKKEEDKIKREIEKKDQELMAQIGSILNATSDFADTEKVSATPMDIDSVSPLKAKLSDMSLPPKERKKRIFKTRNNCQVVEETVKEEVEKVIEVPVVVEEEKGVKHQEEDVKPEAEADVEIAAVAVPKDVEEIVTPSTDEPVTEIEEVGDKVEPDQTDAKEQEAVSEPKEERQDEPVTEMDTRSESPPTPTPEVENDQKVTQAVPRKRRFEKQIPEESIDSIAAVIEEPSVKSPTSDSPEKKKSRREPTPEPIEQALKEICGGGDKPDEKEEVVAEESMDVDEQVVKEDEVMKEEDQSIEEDAAEEDAVEDVAKKPKINNSNVVEAEEPAAKEDLPVTTLPVKNGDTEKSCPVPTSSAESSPVKTNDLLSSTKVVQKVQILQRVRTQDGSEVTETKVAKISTADTGNVLTVAITSTTTPTPDEEQSPTAVVAATEAEEKTSNGGLNGSAAHQESPATTPTESSASPEASNSDPQILAIPGETFGGPANSFYLCTVDDGNFIPIDNQPLYLDASNQLVPTPPTMQTVVVMEGDVDEDIETEELITEEDDEGEVMPQIVIGPDDQVVDLTDTEQKYILTTGTGQQILLDLQSLLTIASGGEAPRLVCDGQEMVIEGTPQEILSSITLSTGANEEGYEEQASHDILGGALTENVLYPTVSTAYVSETNAVLTQPPIMSTLEVPSKADVKDATAATNLEESLAVIGVKKESTKSIPSSLELPITITNPKIAAKTTQASIKSVYMTTTAVCGSKVEAATSEYWAGAEGVTGKEVESNGHEAVVMEDDQIVMVVEEEGEDEIIAEEVQEEEIILSEASEFAT